MPTAKDMKLYLSGGNNRNYREIMPENVGKKSEKYPELIPENSRNNPGKMPEKSPENVQNITEKTLEKPEKMVVKKPENSQNYDSNTIEYCCIPLKHLVISDGRAIKLNENGLVLVNNPGYPVFRLKYCPNCGTEIEHTDTSFVEKSVEEPKELLRDNMKNKPPA